MTFKVAIGASSFAAADPAPLRLLEAAGVKVLPNPYGRKLTEEEIMAHLVGVDGLLAGLEPLTRRVLTNSPSLRAIARIGVGMTNVDLGAAEELGVKVSNTPDGPTEAVAELTLAAMLGLARKIHGMNNAMHDGQWEKQMGTGLKGSTALVVGFGRIGRRVSEILDFLGVKILAYDPFTRVDDRLAKQVSLEDGLPVADFILVHAGGEQVILGAKEFASCKDGVYVLNAGRGGLVDEAALEAALAVGKVGGAWLDVFESEPYVGPLAESPQVIATPHVGTYTVQCRVGMECAAVENLLRHLGEE